MLFLRMLPNRDREGGGAFLRVLPNRDREGVGAYFNSATGTVNDAVFTTPLRWNCTQIL